MEFDEKKIITLCQKGDFEKFGLLYDAYVNNVYKFIYYKTHHRETAEDLTSKTFMKALGGIGNFDSGKGHFSSWIYQIARNNVIDHFRTKKNEGDINDIWDLSDNSDLDRDADIRQKLKEVEKYLKKLGSEKREIIIMRVWQEMQYKEIAEIMGKSEASCKMMFSRAIKELRKEMTLEMLVFFLLLKLQV